MNIVIGSRGRIEIILPWAREIVQWVKAFASRPDKNSVWAGEMAWR